LIGNYKKFINFQQCEEVSLYMPKTLLVFIARWFCKVHPSTTLPTLTRSLDRSTNLTPGLLPPPSLTPPYSLRPSIPSFNTTHSTLTSPHHPSNNNQHQKYVEVHHRTRRYGIPNFTRASELLYVDVHRFPSLREEQQQNPPGISCDICSSDTSNINKAACVAVAHQFDNQHHPP
jgi:hypothetical protein